MDLFQWNDKLIVARDLADARSLLLEHYTPQELARRPVRLKKGTVDLTVDNGETYQDYLPSEVVQMCGRGLIPDIG